MRRCGWWRQKRASMRAKAKRLVKLVASTLGLDIDAIRREIIRRDAAKARRTTQGAVLENAYRLGFRPRTIIDVGVGYGTPWLYKRLDGVDLLLVEPLL